MLDVETEKYFGFSRPRLIETEILGNSLDVETKTSLNWAKRCRYRDSMETLADFCPYTLDFELRFRLSV